MLDNLGGLEIVVLLLPLTAETTNLIDAGRLALLAPGAALINPGRGPLIDDAALLAALDGGRLGHATLDVFRTEPLPPDHPLWDCPNLAIAPHSSGSALPALLPSRISRRVRTFQCPPASNPPRARRQIAI